MLLSTSRLRTPIKRARGLGSAHGGTHHFWLQRISALAIVPLSVWFMVQLVTFITLASRPTIAMWFKNPFHALAVGALMVAMFVHARLGVQEIIADYVPQEGKKFVLLLLNNLFVYGCCALSLMAILRLNFLF